MDAKDYEYWKMVVSDFEESGLTEKEYCLREGLEPGWIEKQRVETAAYEKRLKTSNAKNTLGSAELFVELEFERGALNSAPVAGRISSVGAAVSHVLKASCRDVVFELPCGFDASEFKRALSVVREGA